MSIFVSFLLQFCFTRFHETQVTNCLTGNYKKTLNFALQRYYAIVSDGKR